MEDIAKDPDYASKTLKLMVGGTDLMECNAAVNDPTLSPEERAAQSMAGLKHTQSFEAQAKVVQRQRRDIYDRETAKGTPPAQIYAEMLKFNASLPDSYGNQIQPNEAPGNWKLWQTAQLAHLQGAMSKTEEASA